MKSKLSTIKEAKKSSRQERKKIRMSQSASEPGKKNPKYYGYGKLQLPVEVLQELKIIKLAYQIAWKDKDGNLPRLTYGDLMGRLIAGAKRNDPEIVPCLADAKAVFGDEKLYMQNNNQDVDEVTTRAEANVTSLKEQGSFSEEDFSNDDIEKIWNEARNSIRNSIR